VTASTFQVSDESGRGENIGKPGVGGAGAAHCTGGHEGQPVVVSQPGQDVGESGIGGTSIQGELNGQTDSGVSLDLWATGRGSGA